MRTRGVGPTPCDFMLVADYPNRVEAQTGIPVSGKVGDEVNRRCDGISLPGHDDWYMCNLIREWNPANEYTHSDVARDEPELVGELATVAPKLIVTLGRWSARYFLGDVNLDEVQALPWLDPKDHSRVIFPITNPAAGFRSPEIQAHVDWGFRELALYVAGDIAPRELFKDEHPNPTYICIEDPKWLAGCLRGVKEISIDTEGRPGRVWSIQWSLAPGTAYMVRFADRKCLSALVNWMLHERPRVVFHGSLHDFGIIRNILQSLGLPVEALYDLEFDDTQIMAYLLQLEPIGLKPNAVRHCNMVMQDYMEVLGDAQIRLSQDYLVRIFDAEQAKYEARQREEFARINAEPLRDSKTGAVKRTKDGAIRYRRTTVLPALPKTDLHKAALRVLGSQDPFKLWQEQREDILVAAYNTEVPDATR